MTEYVQQGYKTVDLMNDLKPVPQLTPAEYRIEQRRAGAKWDAKITGDRVVAEYEKRYADVQPTPNHETRVISALSKAIGTWSHWVDDLSEDSVLADWAEYFDRLRYHYQNDLDRYRLSLIPDVADVEPTFDVLASFEVKPIDLLPVVKALGATLDNRTPALASVLFSIESGRVTLTSTNISKTTVKAIATKHTHGNGSWLLAHDTLLMLVGMLNDTMKHEPMVFGWRVMSDGQYNLRVRCGNSTYNLKIMTADEFPQQPQTTETVHLFDCHKKDLLEGLNWLYKVIKPNNDREVLQGVNVKIEGGTCYLQGANGNEILRYELPAIVYGQAQAQTVLLTKASINSLSDELSFALTKDAGTLFISDYSTQIALQTFEVFYPDVDMFFKRDLNDSFGVNFLRQLPKASASVKTVEYNRAMLIMRDKDGNRLSESAFDLELDFSEPFTLSVQAYKMVGEMAKEKKAERLYANIDPKTLQAGFKCGKVAYWVGLMKD